MFGIMKGVDRLDMEKMFPLETIDRGTVRITSKRTVGFRSPDKGSLILALIEDKSSSAKRSLILNISEELVLPTIFD